jgi:preprotein translocase SecF subunit
MIKIIQRRKIWFALSLFMVVTSIAALAVWGLRLGIDFTGGTLMEVGFNGTSLSNQEIKDALKGLNLGEINIQSSGSGTTFLRFKNVDETTHQAILTALNKEAASMLGTGASVPTAGSATPIITTQQNAAQQNAPIRPVQIDAKDASGSNVAVDAVPVTTPAPATDAAATPGATAPTDTSAQQASTTAQATATDNKYVAEKSFESIGPVVGNELQSSAKWALAIAVIAIILYIAWAFRKVSYPVSSFKYGIIAAVALLHDVLSTVGVFAVLGHFLGIEVGISFVAALLTILGYSVHDTIVVFDRIRENLFRFGSRDFEETVNNCVNETLARSINTSFTVILTLTALFLFGGSSIRYFVLALIVGVTVGTYSSIFVASPLLVTWQKFDDNRKK